MDKEKGRRTLEPMWVVGGVLKRGRQYGYVYRGDWHLSEVRVGNHIFDVQEGYSNPQPLIQLTYYCLLFRGGKKDGACAAR